MPSHRTCHDSTYKAYPMIWVSNQREYLVMAARAEPLNPFGYVLSTAPSLSIWSAAITHGPQG